MALIDKSLSEISKQAGGTPVIGGLLDTVKSELRAHFAGEVWKEYHAHENDTVVNVLGIFKKTVKQIPFIRQLLEKLVGPDPMDGVVQPLGN